MSFYHVVHGKTNTATTTIGGITASAAGRVKVGHIIISSAAAPADNACEYQFKRYSAPGTATAITASALDQADPLRSATTGEAHTIEPTYIANSILLDFAANQRATPQWIARPGWELTIPAVASNGIGCFSKIVGGSAFAVSLTWYFEE